MNEMIDSHEMLKESVNNITQSGNEVKGKTVSWDSHKYK